MATTRLMALHTGTDRSVAKALKDSGGAGLISHIDLAV